MSKMNKHVGICPTISPKFMSPSLYSYIHIRPTYRYLQLDQTSQITKCSRLNFLNMIVPNISKKDKHTL